MVKVIEKKPVPTAQVRCKDCGSLLEYSNSDLWRECDVDSFTYPLRDKYSFDCPVCKCKIYVERIALKGEEDKV